MFKSLEEREEKRSNNEVAVGKRKGKCQKRRIEEEQPCSTIKRREKK
jgi:hypothetical protein